MSFDSLKAWASQQWESPAERIAAYASKRYSDPNDQGYRDAVASKEATTMGTEPNNNRSSGGPKQVHVSTHDSSNAEEGVEGFTPATQAELQEYANTHGYLAMDPNLKITPRAAQAKTAPDDSFDALPDHVKASVADYVARTVKGILDAGNGNGGAA